MTSALPVATACWVTNANPGLKVGTEVFLVHPVERVHNEKAIVYTEDGKPHTIHSLSLAAMLPEEIPQWIADLQARAKEDGHE